MSDERSVLLVSAQPELENQFRRILGAVDGVSLNVAPTLAAAMKRIPQQPPDLVFASEELAGAAWSELVRAIREGRDEGAVELVAVIEAEHAGSGKTGTPAFAEPCDDWLIRPVRPAHLLGRVRRRLKMNHLAANLAAERRQRERLEEELVQGFEQLFAVLTRVAEMGVPGALDRGIRIAAMARKLADRFQIPEPLLRDLDVAARLHEIGRVVSSEASALTTATSPALDAWQYTQSTKALLEDIDWFKGAAELVGGVYENWDGTGFPERLLKGQIPLRCRILRVLVDFFAIMHRPGKPTTDEALDELTEHAGTRYDPMVVVHLRTLIQEVAEGELENSRMLIPIQEMREGMVLAEDLYTASGLKLMSKDTPLNTATLEIILSRHKAEPILHGAVVRRSAA